MCLSLDGLECMTLTVCFVCVVCVCIQVTILTGRPHQIRIHMAALGHPLVGDPLYGPGGVPKVGLIAGSRGVAHVLTVD